MTERRPVPTGSEHPTEDKDKDKDKLKPDAPDRPSDGWLTNRHVQDQLGLLQLFAPDGVAQQICSEMVNEMQRDGMPPSEQMRVLAGCIYDGLSHGTWPWPYTHTTENSRTVGEGVDQYGRL